MNPSGFSAVAVDCSRDFHMSHARRPPTYTHYSSQYLSKATNKNRNARFLTHFFLSFHYDYSYYYYYCSCSWKKMKETKRRRNSLCARNWNGAEPKEENDEGKNARDRGEVKHVKCTLQSTMYHESHLSRPNPRMRGFGRIFSSFLSLRSALLSQWAIRAAADDDDAEERNHRQERYKTYKNISQCERIARILFFFFSRIIVVASHHRNSSITLRISNTYLRAVEPWLRFFFVLFSNSHTTNA